MITLFISDSEKRMSSMVEALEQNKADRLAAAAHGLGGGGVIIGAYRLAELCSPLQELPRVAESERRELVGAIQKEYAEVRHLLDLTLKTSC
jgi:HPt (histidine-containing phosphotransfer) domain-containing protein